MPIHDRQDQKHTDTHCTQDRSTCAPIKSPLNSSHPSLGKKTYNIRRWEGGTVHWNAHIEYLSIFLKRKYQPLLYSACIGRPLIYTPEKNRNRLWSDKDEERTIEWSALSPPGAACFQQHGRSFVKTEDGRSETEDNRSECTMQRFKRAVSLGVEIPTTTRGWIRASTVTRTDEDLTPVFWFLRWQVVNFRISASVFDALSDPIRIFRDCCWCGLWSDFWLCSAFIIIVGFKKNNNNT